MRRHLLIVLVTLFASTAFAENVIELRITGVEYAANGDYKSAKKYLCKSARLGYYTAQVECGYHFNLAQHQLQTL